MIRISIFLNLIPCLLADNDYSGELTEDIIRVNREYSKFLGYIST